MKTLGHIGIKAFDGRSISPETAVRFGVYTAEKSVDGSVVPSERGNIIVFPFIERGEVVGEKYRAPGKVFWQRAGGKRTFWNADALDDPALETGHAALVITEGEIDALTAIDCGFALTVSVPDGAPAVPEGEDPEKELAPLRKAEEEQGTKFDFVWNNRERLKRIKRFILATDGDAPGRRLAAELVRRLSASRCQFVTYPDGCKDLNEVRMKLGADAVVSVLTSAKPYPVQGLYRLNDYPDVPGLETFSTGWPGLDRYAKLFTPAFMVVTGIPGHGKTQWVLNLLSNAAERHGWRSAIFSPEMPTKPQIRDILRRLTIRRDLFSFESDDFRKADEWINDMFLFIDADPRTRDGEEDFNLDWLLDKATDAVLRDGIRILVIDPWNEVEHAKDRMESMTDYIGRGIRALKKFARHYDVMVIVVAHPTKEVGKDGKGREATLYDIDGSAHWFNKPDIGIVIDRPDPEVNETSVRVAKVRFRETGEKGRIRLSFDRAAGRFIEVNQE